MTSTAAKRTGKDRIDNSQSPSAVHRRDAPPEPPKTPQEGETSWAGRIVAVFTPVLAVFASWIAGWVAHAVPGAHLDGAQVTALMVAAATAVLGAAWKWLQGWQQHESAVAHGLVRPCGRKRRSPRRPRSPRPIG